MKPISLRLAVLLGGLVLALFVTTSSVQADEWNRETRITPDHDIEVPGAVLQANTTYVMKLLDSPAERKVVQVFNEDQTELLTTFFAVNDERMEPVEDTTFEFMEVPAGYPVPVQSWFYPGRSIGLEFLYSKDDMNRFAGYRSQDVAETDQLAQQQPLPGTEEDLVDRLESEPVENEPELAAVQDEPAADADLDQNAVEDGRSDQTKPSAVGTIGEDQEIEELPRTAGALNLLGLLGAAAAACGAFMHLNRRS
jgi:hypothetical protein